MFVNVQYVSGVVIAAPSGRPVFRRVSPCVRFFEQNRVCIPTFACESERGAFVSQIEKRDEKRLVNKIYGGSFAGVFPSADGEGSQRTGKCMYIKAGRNKRDSAGSSRPRCGRGREGPCFAVCAPVCDFSPKAECVPAFMRESERGPSVPKVLTSV